MHVSLRSCFKRLPNLLHPLESTPIHTFKRCISTSVVTTAHSIRNAIVNGEFNQGYQLFTEFYANEFQNTTTISSSNGQIIRPKSPYLAHVLIHALHRSQQPLSAASVTKMCMERGFKIRGHTFVTVFAAISPPCDFTVPVARPGRSKDSPPIVLINAAVGLLKAARNSGHKHHSWMYDRVINALLLQGEVLTAAFLFITLLKEWNARRAAKSVEEVISPEESASRIDIAHTLYAMAPRRPFIQTYVVDPQDIWMRKITAALKERIHDPENPTSDSLKTRTMKALDALVKLLAESSQYLPGRHHILQILRSALSTGYVDDATSKHFRSILLCLCQRPRKRPGLDIFSYHVLLRYALQDEKSIDLGVDVLRALVESYDPTLVTYNILLHDISLLGDIGTVEAIARILNDRNCFAIGTLLAKTDQQAQKEIIECLSSRPVPIIDEYTTVTMMTHAIARGDPHAACRYVVQMFPELDNSKVWSDQAHRNVVKQAKRLSPHFWATAQRAAVMANNLKLSMSIWRLVMRTEKMQYNPETGDMVSPLYNATAYTSQFQFFSTKLQKIFKVIQELLAEKADKTTQERVQSLFNRYNHLLVYIERILVTLKERSLGNSAGQKTVIAGFKLDKRLIRELFIMVERILMVGQGLPALAHHGADPSQGKSWPEQYNEHARPHRILGIVRKIVQHHGVPHPFSPKLLGFEGHANESFHPPGQQDSAPRTLATPGILKKQQPKHPAFKVKYSATVPSSQRPPKGRHHKTRTLGKMDGDITKRFLQMLEHANKVTAKTPA
jgi:hypothetical protein